ncbi:MAG TPA: hypothetical protein VL172_00210, partial [Kofleriaceae bacterium]|nr:hypothetical protein [Kofleriaceae bacterium]
MEGEQVQQVVVAARRDDLEAAHAVARLAAVDRLDRAEVDDLLEQLDQVVGLGRVVERADPHFERARDAALRRRRRCLHRLREHGLARLRHRHGLARDHRADAGEQVLGVDRVATGALVARELGAQRVARLQQHVDHRRGRRELVAAQLVEQRLHLVGQLGDVGEAERRGAALDRVRAAEDRIQLLVVGRLDVDLEQLLLHAVQVLAGLFEEDLVELAQIDAGAQARALVRHLTHGERLRALCL